MASTLQVVKQGCDCEKCRNLCSNCNPGWFSPGQPTKAAKYLGLDFLTFFEKYLIVEFWAEDLNLYVLAPRRVDQDNFVACGLDNYKRDTACRLLGDFGCLLPHNLRPTECAMTYACRPNNPELRYEIATSWLWGKSKELTEISKELGLDF